MRHVPGRMVPLGLALLVFAVVAACSGGDDSSEVSSESTIPGATTIEGRARIEGTITTMVAGAASFDVITAPFTVEVPEAGTGSLEVIEASIDGKLKTIAWSAGRPLPVTGTCGLEVGEADVSIADGTLVVGLDGDYRTLTAGKCKFGSSVAVGDADSGLLGEPVNSYSFNLDEAAEFTTEGGATVAATGARRYEGRRGTLGLAGDLRITTEDKKYTTDRLGLDVGYWTVVLSKTDDPKVLKVVADVEGILNFDTA